MSNSETYCVKCRKFTPTQDVSYTKTKNNRTLMIGTCPICHKKKSYFVKKKSPDPVS
jgi:RNase P subunit RPR2